MHIRRRKKGGERRGEEGRRGERKGEEGRGGERKGEEGRGGERRGEEGRGGEKREKREKREMRRGDTREDGNKIITSNFMHFLCHAGHLKVDTHFNYHNIFFPFNPPPPYTVIPNMHFKHI